MVVEDPTKHNNNDNDENVAISIANNGNCNQARAAAASTTNNRALMPINNNISQIASTRKSQKKS